MRLPGVSCPDDDTALLLDCLLSEDLPPGASVLDLGVNPGQIAELLERAGAGQTKALDLRRRSARTRLRGRPWAPRPLGRFDLIVANVPFFVRDADTARLLDRVCRDAPRHLAEDGTLWLVHSGLLDSGIARRLLAEAGLSVEVVECREVSFGPAMWSRAAALRADGLISGDQCTENLFVLRARRSESA